MVPKEEVLLLSKGLSFCPTPPPNESELNDDLYKFSRLLRLKFHFKDSSFEDHSIVKLPSSFTPAPNASTELEVMINKLKHLNVVMDYRIKDNIKGLRTALSSLIDRITKHQIIIKPADKGDIIVIMSVEFYKQMCLNELSKQDFYKIIGDNDPSMRVMNTVKQFAEKYESTLTRNEFRFLTEGKYRMAYFYMLPKLHKSNYINNNINHSEYVHFQDFQHQIEGRPIVAGPSFYTSGLSEMVSIILKPMVHLLPQILQDSFDLIERTETDLVNHVVLGTCDIKALYTNISIDLAIKAIDFWISKYGDSVHTFRRFSKQFVLNALLIILENNFFLFDEYFVQQIKGFAMGTKCAVDCANLIVGYLEVKMFALLPTVYPVDVVDFIIRNYFRLLDDIFFKWLKNYDVSKFYEIFDKLDADLQFIFSHLSTATNFLDIYFKIVDNKLIMDLYCKPTDSHSYLNYTSAHPQHTKDNIALSLAKRIVRIVSDNREKCLDALKHHLVAREHPIHKINYAFSKVFQPKRNPDSKNIIVFTSTFNPKHRYNRKIIKNITADLTSPKLRGVFGDMSVVMSTRQPSSLRDMLVSSKFCLNPVKPPRAKGMFYCPRTCRYHRLGYIVRTTSFTFGKNNQFRWEYTRFFNCDSNCVIYLLQCNYCWKFYIGETGDVKERTRLHISNVYHPENSNCKKLSLHLNHCSRLKEPFFIIYPYYYVKDMQHRRFIEKRHIHAFKPPLNGDS